MGHSFVQNNLHVVFSTKERQKMIAQDLQPELWSYMAGICRNIGVTVMAIGGFEDHAHLFFHLPPTSSLSKVTLTIKANSSRWMRETNRRFAWQEGFSAFSVSASNRASVVEYIRNQKRHHQKMTFEDELLKLLKKHGIEYDPKYVFG